MNHLGKVILSALLAICSAGIAQQTPAVAQRQALNKQLSRDRFLTIEKIARLAPAEQAGQIEQAYIAAEPVINFEEARSSQMMPANLMVRDRTYLEQRNVRDTSAWIPLLNELAKTKSPEAVADGILTAHGTTILDFVSRRRAIDLFGHNQEALTKLLDRDLSAPEVAVIRRALTTIGSLRFSALANRVGELMRSDNLAVAQAAKQSMNMLQRPVMPGSAKAVLPPTTRPESTIN
jgi:hypothetical protein